MIQNVTSFNTIKHIKKIHLISQIWYFHINQAFQQQGHIMHKKIKLGNTCFSHGIIPHKKIIVKTHTIHITPYSHTNSRETIYLKFKYKHEGKYEDIGTSYRPWPQSSTLHDMISFIALWHTQLLVSQLLNFSLINLNQDFLTWKVFFHVQLIY